jgi:hypothetical protein
MKTTTATVIMQQSLSHDCVASSFIESKLEALNDMEFELEDILFQQLQQGLPTDILANV